MAKSKFSFYHQTAFTDCGPACLKMIALYYGKQIRIETLRHLSGIAKDGVSLLGIAEAAEQTGFEASGVRLTYEQLFSLGNFPCIAHWEQNHFVVIVNKAGSTILVADPGKGMLELSEKEFLSKWLAEDSTAESGKGIVLLLKPGKAFFERPDEKDTQTGWGVLLRYLVNYRKYIIQVILGLLIASLLQLVIPLLTKLIVDKGIGGKNLSLIYLVVIAQFALMLSRTGVEFLRSRILLFISTRISLTILSDFWTKMLRLPLSFYDTKMSGDVMQRVGDQKRIENFLTGSTLNILFSLFTLAMFSVLFLLYNWRIYLIFMGATVLYFFWIRYFLRSRRKIDFEQFDTGARENTATIELIQGMQDIKLYNAENYFRWKWEEIQVSSFRLTYKSLSLSQRQEAGALLINEGKNIIITLLAATAVVNNEMSLGAMVAMQYILGQVSSPVDQLVAFSQHAQDAGISLERFSEINAQADEEHPDAVYENDLSGGRSIHIRNLYFKYPGAGNDYVLKNFSLEIPENKITAIVGMSGNGKTTLLKLLLRFYQQYEGSITVGNGNIPFEKIAPSFWRSHCGSVLQDSYIFNESIRKNIAVGETEADEEKLLQACKVANIADYILSLPQQFDTKIGPEGSGISGGQKQRILIARAVYRSPAFIFFDEATNSLDANNENLILKHLQSFFRDRTVVIVAHRMSTIKHADKIVVIENGEVAEEGTHSELLDLHSKYYQLIKNQMNDDNIYKSELNI
ncbi:MAG: peptidase domain-containing ABC transporter [Bacteroidetes bacterium]|nr:peptidase domain-containing ABC transporter [Bacteroidota bacterium]